jgi:AcrR family transcriptional regulator
MMGMSIPYEATGRTSQKARTRDAILDAARDLIAAGATPTVEQAAARASISRTTAYRYFPNQRSMLTAAHPYIEQESLVPLDDDADAASRLDAVVKAHTRQILELEPQLRTMLRLSLEATETERRQLLLRKGRAIGWIEAALEPLRDDWTAADIHRLALAIRTTEGIEALVWLTDVAGLSRSDAVDVMRWSARALLRTALADGPPPARSRGTTRRRSNQGVRAP